MAALTPSAELAETFSPDVLRFLYTAPAVRDAAEALVAYLYSGACAGLQMPAEWWTRLDALEMALAAAGACGCHRDPAACPRHGAEAEEGR